MKLEKLLEYIDPEKLPWDYQEFVGLVGLEKTLEIAKRVGGTHIYMEKLESILSPFIRAYAIEKFHEARRAGEKLNVREVARDMDVSQETIYEIIRTRHAVPGDKSGWQQESLI